MFAGTPKFFLFLYLEAFLFTSHLQARQRPPLHGLRLQEGAAGHCHPVVRGLQPLQGPNPNPASFLLWLDSSSVYLSFFYLDFPLSVAFARE